MFKIPLAIWVAGSVALAGGLWLKEHDERVRSATRAEKLEKQVDSLVLDATKAKLMIMQKDDAVAAQKVLLAAQNMAMVEAQAKAKKRTGEVVASLRQKLDSVQTAELDTIVSGYEAQLTTKDSMFAAQLRLTNLAEERIAVRDSAYQKLEQASNVVYKSWQIEKKRASPSLAKKIIRAIPVVATTVAVTLIVAGR